MYENIVLWSILVPKAHEVTHNYTVRSSLPDIVRTLTHGNRVLFLKSKITIFEILSKLPYGTYNVYCQQTYARDNGINSGGKVAVNMS